MGALKFYRCNECGNLFLVLVDPSVVPTCCAHEMEELEPIDPKQAEDCEEKHTPIIETSDNKAKVRIGGIHSHPMEAEHRIEWIIFVNGPRVDIQRLKLTSEPEAEFTIRHKDEKLYAYAFCNLHGLWESKR